MPTVTPRSIALLTVFLALWCGAFWGCGGQGGNPADAVALSQLNGTVARKADAASAFAPAKDGDRVQAGGAVRTSESSRATLSWADQTQVTLQPETYFEIKAGGALGVQNQGSAIFKVAPQQRKGATVETPHGTTAVLGTTFLVRVASDGTAIWVDEGSVEFTAKNGEKKTITTGQTLAYGGSGTLADPRPVPPPERDQLFRPTTQAPALNQQ